MGRGGEEDLGFDPRAARALEAVGRGGAGPDSGAHFALWRLRGEQALGDEGGSRKPGPADCSGPDGPGQVEEAQEGKKWAGSWLTTKMEPTGSMVEDRTG